jgi:hypothetical protein
MNKNVAPLLWLYFAFYVIRYKGTRVLLKFALHRRALLGYAALGYTLCIGIRGKAVPLQAWSDPEGSRKLRLQDNGTGWW